MQKFSCFKIGNNDLDRRMIFYWLHSEYSQIPSLQKSITDFSRTIGNPKLISFPYNILDAQKWFEDFEIQTKVGLLSLKKFQTTDGSLTQLRIYLQSLQTILFKNSLLSEKSLGSRLNFLFKETNLVGNLSMFLDYLNSPMVAQDSQANEGLIWHIMVTLVQIVLLICSIKDKTLVKKFTIMIKVFGDLAVLLPFKEFFNLYTMLFFFLQGKNSDRYRKIIFSEKVNSYLVQSFTVLIYNIEKESKEFSEFFMIITPFLLREIFGVKIKGVNIFSNFEFTQLSDDLLPEISKVFQLNPPANKKLKTSKRLKQQSANKTPSNKINQIISKPSTDSIKTDVLNQFQLNKAFNFFCFLLEVYGLTANKSPLDFSKKQNIGKENLFEKHFLEQSIGVGHRAAIGLVSDFYLGNDFLEVFSSFFKFDIQKTLCLNQIEGSTVEALKVVNFKTLLFFFAFFRILETKMFHQMKLYINSERYEENACMVHRMVSV